MKRETAVARSGSSALTSFFTLAGKSFEILSRSPNIYGLEDVSQSILEDYIESWKQTPLVGLGVIGVDGKYKFLANTEGVKLDPNVSVADRDYFKWASGAKTGEVLFSPAIISRTGASKGKYIIAMTTPIRNEEGEFVGLISGAILLDQLTEQYVDPLKTNSETRAYLVNRGDALIIYSPEPEMLGKSVFEAVGGQDFLGKDFLETTARNSISQEKEGSIKVALPGNDSKLEPYLISWSPVTLGDLKWHVVIMDKEEDVLQLISPFYIRNILFLYLGFLAIAIVLVHLAKKKAYVTAQEDEHKFHQIGDHTK